LNLRPSGYEIDLLLVSTLLLLITYGASVADIIRTKPDRALLRPANFPHVTIARPYTECQLQLPALKLHQSCAVALVQRAQAFGDSGLADVQPPSHPFDTTQFDDRFQSSQRVNVKGGVVYS